MMRILQENRKEKWLFGAFLLGVFAFLIVFFLGYYPLVVNNLDDWTYLTFRRSAVPAADEWNPAKVLPEILMPACAQLAVWLVMPLTGDYMQSMSIVFTVVLCLFIALYIVLFARFLLRMMKVDTPMAILLSVLYMVFHFRSWMSLWIPSRHLFYSEALTTYYNYTIPALLNIILVLLMESKGVGKLVSSEHPIAGGVLVLLIYLAIFSNLYCSVILAVYCGVCMMLRLLETILRRMSGRAWMKDCLLYIGVLAAWFVSMVFEFFGSRAGSMASETSLRTRIGQTLSGLFLKIEQMENTVFWLCVLMIAAGAVMLVISRGQSEMDKTYAAAMLRYLLCAVLTLMYLILLSAVVSPDYIGREDVLIGSVFFVFAVAFCSLAYLISRWKIIALAVPLITFIMAFEVMIGIDSFAQSNALQLPQRDCLEIGQAFVESILEADQTEAHEVTISVPAGNERLGNWPYTYNMGGRMLTALKSHGMIENIEAIRIEKDDSFFDTFGQE